MENIKKENFMQVVGEPLEDIELVDNPMEQELTEEEIKDGHIEKTAKFQQMWHQAHTPWVRINKKVGPNEPCPCGSGKKYKKCCMNNGGPVYRLKDDPTYANS